MATAFDELRRYAARLGRRLSDVAAAVTTGDFGPAMMPRGDELRVLLIRRFDADSLSRLRATTSRTTIRHGLSEQQVSQFVLAVHEAAANAIRHGGGTGQYLLWMQGAVLTAEISDHGSGIAGDPRAIPPPGTSSRDGRGLWLISQVCADVDIDTGDTGTRLTLRYPLDSPTAGPADV
jgi:anti-sigma regulatory factor (Ser/Thr protein kinase)